MRHNIYLPPELQRSIRRHIKRSVNRAVEAHKSGREDEDTLTGQLGVLLRTPRPITVKVTGDNVPGSWTWRLDYRKLRGRGPRATERILGADGVFEFSLTHNGEQVRKGALFQAKTEAEDRQRLLAQLIKLSTWKEAAFTVRYGTDAYSAMDFDAAYSAAIGAPGGASIPLDAFIMDWFVACLVGDSELSYSGEERLLTWRDLKGERVEASFSIRHHLALRVDGPLPSARRYSRRIDPVEIYEHRMEATDEELLGIKRDATVSDLKRAKRNAAKRYHTDRYQQLESSERYVLDLRLKETNAAADRVAARLVPEDVLTANEDPEPQPSDHPKGTKPKKTRPRA